MSSGKSLEDYAVRGEQFGVLDLSLHFMYYRDDLIDKLQSDAGWQKIYGEISQKYLGKTLSPRILTPGIGKTTRQQHCSSQRVSTPQVRHAMELFCR